MCSYNFQQARCQILPIEQAFERNTGGWFILHLLATQDFSGSVVPATQVSNCFGKPTANAVADHLHPYPKRKWKTGKIFSGNGFVAAAIKPNVLLLRVERGRTVRRRSDVGDGKGKMNKVKLIEVRGPIASHRSGSSIRLSSHAASISRSFGNSRTPFPSRSPSPTPGLAARPYKQIELPA